MSTAFTIPSGTADGSVVTITDAAVTAGSQILAKLDGGSHHGLVQIDVATVAAGSFGLLCAVDPRGGGASSTTSADATGTYTITDQAFDVSGTLTLKSLTATGTLSGGRANDPAALSLWIPTFGARAGLASDGVLAGAFTATAVGSCQKALTGGTVYSSLTTAANNATTADVTFGLAAVNDALYISHATLPFCAVKAKYTTAGSYSATTLWEYYNGTTWVNLATSNLLLDSSASSGAFKQTAGTYFITFSPPSDWATTTVNSVSGYWVRVRVSAFTSVSTAPALDQLWVYPLTTGTGLHVGSAGTLSRVDFLATTTLSASNNDSKFLIVNGTTGTSYVFTATKAATISTDTTIALACATTDQLAVMQLQQDGSTEFAGVNVRLLITPT